jgi:hypothetical protein
MRLPAAAIRYRTLGRSEFLPMAADRKRGRCLLVVRRARHSGDSNSRPVGWTPRPQRWMAVPGPLQHSGLPMLHSQSLTSVQRHTCCRIEPLPRFEPRTGCKTFQFPTLSSRPLIRGKASVCSRTGENKLSHRPLKERVASPFALPLRTALSAAKGLGVDSASRVRGSRPLSSRTCKKYRWSASS